MLLCIVYGILFVDTVNTKIKASNALNAMFVETVNTPYTEYYEVWKLYSTLYKVASHLIIQLIFNPQKVLKSWDSGLFNHTIITIYLDTVDTRHKYF